MNRNQNFQFPNYSRGTGNFHEALSEAYLDRVFTYPEYSLVQSEPVAAEPVKLARRTKFALFGLFLLFASVPAWCGESDIEQAAIAVTASGTAGLGCGAGGFLVDYGSRGTAKPGTILKGCAAGALIVGGMTTITLEANSEDAWEQSVLENSDSEK